MSQSETPAAAKPAARGSKKLILIVLVVVILGGAGGGFWWYTRAEAHAAAAEPHEKPHKEPTGIVPMEPFLVNLADSNASRFLRVTLRLVVDDEAEAKELGENAVALTRARSAILELLATQESTTLVSAEGKTALKHAIAEKATAVLGVEVRDVLFTDFVVQF
jgi:flagellar FliL protein